MGREKNEIVLLIGNKNEVSTYGFVFKFFDQLALYRIVATATQTNKISSLQHPNIEYFVSLTNKGDTQVAKRIALGAVKVVICLEYYKLHEKEITSSQLGNIISTASKNDVTVIFNEEMANSYITNELSQGVSVNAAVTDEAKVRFFVAKEPTFLDDHTQRLVDRGLRFRQLFPGQVQGSLEGSHIEFLSKHIVVGKLKNPDDPNNQTYVQYAEEHQTDDTDYFAPDDEVNNLMNNTSEPEGFSSDMKWDYSPILKLTHLPKEKAVEYLATGRDSALRDFWNYELFKRDILTCYPIYYSDAEFVNLLEKFYKAPPPSFTEETDEDLSPANTVKDILHDFFLMDKCANFQGNLDLIEEMRALLEVIEEDDPESASSLKDMFETLLQQRRVTHAKKPPKIKLPNKKSLYLPAFLRNDSEEIARQITLMQQEHFSKIRSLEFLNGAWTKKDAMVLAPHLTNFINHTNRISHWVITEVLEQEIQDLHTQMIAKWIEVAVELHKMHNYNAVMAIFSALEGSAISKLKKAWDELGSNYQKDFEVIKEVVSFMGHFKNYRIEVNNLPPGTPCIPLIPVTCSDLNGIGEVFDKRTEEGNINLEYCRKVSNLIWGVKKFQQFTYNYEPYEDLQRYFKLKQLWEGDRTCSAIAYLRNKFENGPDFDNKSARSSRTMSRRPKHLTASIRTNQEESLEFTEADFALLSAGQKAVTYKPGEVVLEAGIVNHNLFRIRRGIVDVVKDGKTVAQMSEGAMFGEISMLLKSDSITTATIVANTEVEIHQYFEDYVYTVCNANPSISRKLNRILCSKLANRLKNFGSSEKKEEKNKRKRVEEKKDEPKEKVEKDTKKKKKDKTKKDKDDDDQYKDVRKNFKLDKSEPIIQEFACSYNNKAGILYVTINYLCLYQSVFAYKKKLKISISKVRKISQSTVGLTIEAEKDTYLLKDFKNGSELYRLITSLLAQQRSNSSSDDDEMSEVEESKEDRLSPKESDWDLIIRGTQAKVYNKGEVVLQEGVEPPRALFRLSSGSLDVTKDDEDGNTKHLATMVANNQIFGEITFLEGGNATATLRAAEDETTIDVIEGYYLDILFQYYPDLAGRFYHYIAKELSSRLKEREKFAKQQKKSKEDSEEDTNASENQGAKPPRNKTSSRRKTKKSKSKKRRTQPSE